MNQSRTLKLCRQMETSFGFFFVPLSVENFEFLVSELLLSPVVLLTNKFFNKKCSYKSFVSECCKDWNLAINVFGGERFSIIECTTVQKPLTFL